MQFEYLKGNVWFTNLPKPQVPSSVVYGYRPVVVIFSPEGALSSDVVTVAPMTTRDKGLEINVPIKADFLDQQSFVLTNQLVTVPKQSLQRYCGRLSVEQIHEIEKGVLISLGIAPPVVQEVKTSQEALANAKKDRAALEALIPHAVELIAQLEALVGKAKPLPTPKKTRRSPEEIASFLREYEDPHNIRKEVAEAYGFRTPTAAYQFWRKHREGK